MGDITQREVCSKLHCQSSNNRSQYFHLYTKFTWGSKLRVYSLYLNLVNFVVGSLRVRFSPSTDKEDKQKRRNNF